MCVDGKVLAVNGKSDFDGAFKAVTQQDGNVLAVDGFPLFDGDFLAVDGNSNFDGKSRLYRDRPPFRYFCVGGITEHLPGNFGHVYTEQIPSVFFGMYPVPLLCVTNVMLHPLYKLVSVLNCLHTRDLHRRESSDSHSGQDNMN